MPKRQFLYSFWCAAKSQAEIRYIIRFLTFVRIVEPDLSRGDVNSVGGGGEAPGGEVEDFWVRHEQSAIPVVWACFELSVPLQAHLLMRAHPVVL